MSYHVYVHVVFDGLDWIVQLEPTANEIPAPTVGISRYISSVSSSLAVACRSATMPHVRHIGAAWLTFNCDNCSQLVWLILCWPKITSVFDMNRNAALAFIDWIYFMCADNEYLTTNYPNYRSSNANRANRNGQVSESMHTQRTSIMSGVCVCSIVPSFTYCVKDWWMQQLAHEHRTSHRTAIFHLI